MGRLKSELRFLVHTHPLRWPVAGGELRKYSRTPTLVFVPSREALYKFSEYPEPLKITPTGKFPPVLHGKTVAKL